MTKSILIVPCFNEERRILPAVFTAFAEGWREGKFLLVDDGSTDATPRVLSYLQNSSPSSFDVLRLPTNVGKAEAVRQGVLRALRSTPDYVGYWDADLATPLEALPLFETIFKERPTTEIVLGSRVRLLGRDIQRSLARHYLGRCFATAVATTLGVPVYDTQCGAKLFRVTDRLRAVFSQPFTSRWIFDVEILARFITMSHAVPRADIAAIMYELPLPKWHDVPGSKLRITDFARSLFELWRIHHSFRR